VFTEAGAMTVAPYRVVKPDHWIFEETGLREGATFGHKTQHERYGDGASGHETDKISPASPAGTILLAKGLNPGNGGAEMTYYELPGGGAVFAAGSITFPTALFLDEPCSRITRNVLERFLK
ncbi:MAG: N,N-dimethylformamidase, partial [Acidobacteria bacterium]